MFLLLFFAVQYLNLNDTSTVVVVVVVVVAEVEVTVIEIPKVIEEQWFEEIEDISNAIVNFFSMVHTTVVVGVIDDDIVDTYALFRHPHSITATTLFSFCTTSSSCFFLYVLQSYCMTNCYYSLVIVLLVLTLVFPHCYNGYCWCWLWLWLWLWFRW